MCLFFYFPEQTNKDRQQECEKIKHFEFDHEKGSKEGRKEGRKILKEEEKKKVVARLLVGCMLDCERWKGESVREFRRSRSHKAVKMYNGADFDTI